MQIIPYSKLEHNSTQKYNKNPNNFDYPTQPPMKQTQVSPSPSLQKISIKQLGGNYQHPSPIGSSRQYQCPPNHIESDSGDTVTDLKFSGKRDRRGDRDRRRKIFQRKVLRGMVVSQGKRMEQTAAQPYSPNKQYNYGLYETSPSLHPNPNPTLNPSPTNFLTMKDIENPNSQQIINPIHQSHQSHQSHNEQLHYSCDHNQQHEYQMHTNSRSMRNQQYIQSRIEKLPSFAKEKEKEKGHDSYQDYWRTGHVEADTLVVLNGVNEEVRRIRSQIQSQKMEISQLHEKMKKKDAQTYNRQKQLLNSLIGKQDQLTKKQQQLNQSLQKITKVQSQSSHRYQQLLKYQLELQRAKRMQDLTSQNQKLYQQLLRSQTKETVDLTPLTHPVNNNVVGVGRSFRDEDNWKEISALENRGLCGEFQNWNEDDGNNTIRDLLSPLEIGPDYYF